MNPSKGEKLKKVVVGVGWIYAVGIFSFFALRAFLRDLPSFLALVNSFAPFLFVPLLVIAPLATLIRSKWTMIAVATVLILFVGLYGSVFFPRFGSPRCEVSLGLRVMTFNLGMHLGQSEALVAIIEEQEADIVAVQELTSEMAELLGQELGDVYPYTILRSGVETTGLLSRYPVLEAEWIEPSRGGRACLHAIVDWDGVALNVFAIHPLPPGLEWYGDTTIPIGLNDAAPQRQAVEIANRATSTEGLAVIMGDFNMSDQTQAYTEITAVLEDAYRGGGWGFGFTFPQGWRIGRAPVPGPLTRYDFVFHTGELCTEWAQVGCGGGSDHCFVVAQLGREEP